MINNDQLKEKVVLVGICLSDQDETLDSLEELEELMEAAGAESVAAVIQNREQVHPGTYLGKGKIEELKEIIREKEATGIVCDDELSPAQLNNLQDMLDVKVMDRTLVILDIFAKRASTSEGKLQVELAQLKYRASRLTGLGKSMSRLGGGIGTRGPGEKKLEVDRRLIKTRISHLNEELEEVRCHREITRTQRKKNNIPVAAIVGYTNAGKSTLLNRLTGAGVWEMDQVFATLDPTTRLLELPGKQQILLTDTVGFIRKLPHHLIDAFRSTLEEAKYADIIVHVVDAANPQASEQMRIVYETLNELGVENKPVITLLNKQDKITGENLIRDFRADKVILSSAATGMGMEELCQAISDILRKQKVFIARLFDYKEGSLMQQIRENGEILKEEYRGEGIYVEAYVSASLANRAEK